MKDSRVTPNEAAKLLGVSADQVHAWCEAGELPSFRSIKGWRKIDRNALVAFAQKFPERVRPTRKRT